MYDPTVGRWLNLDPLGFEGADVNPNRYVGNEPTNAMDPSGLEEPKGSPGFGIPAVADHSRRPVRALVVYDGGDNIAIELARAASDFPVHWNLRKVDKDGWTATRKIVDAHYRANGPLTQLWIFDHGYSNLGKQQVGDDPIDAERFAEVKGYFGPNATIYLMGCNVGNFPAYSTAVAKYSGCTVVAANAYQTFNVEGIRDAPDFVIEVYRRVWDPVSQQWIQDPAYVPASYLGYSPNGEVSVVTLANPWPFTANDLDARQAVGGDDWRDAFFRWFTFEQ